MKLRSGIYFALAVVLVLLGWYGGNELYFKFLILPRKYPTLEPGKVNLVGLKIPGYRIVVSNGIARLEQGGVDEFGKGEESPGSGATGEVISMRGLLGTLRFDPKAASELTTALAGIKSEIEPLAEATWTEADISSALNGGPKAAKLERDLGVRLDGSGADKLTWRRLSTGIWLAVNVPLSVPLAKSNVVATVLIPYQPRLALFVVSEVEKRLKGGRLEPDAAMLAGIYREAISRLGGSGREVVSDSLRALISVKQKAKLAAPVNALLKGILIIATERQITESSLAEKDNAEGTGKVYELSLGLTGDAKDRLWQYTYSRVGGQLMLVSNDVAIAAPFIQHEIKYSTITITNIADEDLAREALDFIQARTPK